jgi:hypothetical protein
MEKKRQTHADLIIKQANNMDLKFDVQSSSTGEWKLVIETPCKFYEDHIYRLHEREFPKTSLSVDHLECLIFNKKFGEHDLTTVANAAIKQYILDTEKESK